MFDKNTLSEYIVKWQGILIHELLHIKLYGMDQMIESLLRAVYGGDESDPKFAFAYDRFMELLECTAQDLTNGARRRG